MRAIIGCAGSVPSMNCPSCLADNHADAGYCFACGAPLDPSLASLAYGALFASRFEIVGPLGRGGMGMVYRAFDRDLGETVAIKVLRPDIARESGRVEQRFRSEIRLARRVRHRNVCSVYGDGEDRGLLYICMELVEGENLARPAREGGGLPADEAWDVALQVLKGLEAIHEVGIVHRDLKTANLMRDRNGCVRVMDFGIAKYHGDTESGVTVTATGTLMGTPEYMSPEQLRGDEVDFRSDIYSLAIVIYEIFTGSLPFRGDSPVATIIKQLQEPPVLDSVKLPEALRPVLRRALAKSPAERFATATEMREAVQDARSAPVQAHALRPSKLSPDATDDETRPVEQGMLPERVPVLRIAVAQLALLGLAVHLIAAGGVASRSQAERFVPEVHAAGPEPAETRSVASPRPTATPTAVAPAPSIVVGARPVAPASAASPPVSGESLWKRPSVVPGRIGSSQANRKPAPVVDVSRIYRLDEVDVKPRLISGMNAPYPEWGPKLPKGKQVSISATFVVTETGDVTDIRAEKGAGGLEAVLLEISRWKYEPGSKNGVPVKVRVRWRYTYVG